MFVLWNNQRAACDCGGDLWDVSFVNGSAVAFSWTDGRQETSLPVQSVSGNVHFLIPRDVYFKPHTVLDQAAGLLLPPVVGLCQCAISEINDFQHQCKKTTDFWIFDEGRGWWNNSYVTWLKMGSPRNVHFLVCYDSRLPSAFQATHCRSMVPCQDTPSIKHTYYAQVSYWRYTRRWPTLLSLTFRRDCVSLSLRCPSLRTWSLWWALWEMDRQLILKTAAELCINSGKR